MVRARTRTYVYGYVHSTVETTSGKFRISFSRLISLFFLYTVGSTPKSIMGDFKNIMVSDGVVKDIIRQGGPTKVKAGETITVHCTGSLAGNPPKKFWSTKDPGQQPFSFAVGLGKVIKGWDEGCLSMSKGEIALLKIRSDKGYGKSGFPAWGITPNADLEFEIEIL